MPDKYYQTKEWKALRASVLRRDNNVCAVSGCKAKAVVADHIKPRRKGGADAAHNLRSLCEHHHNQRSRGGEPRLIGCDAEGWPIDPARSLGLGGT